MYAHCRRKYESDTFMYTPDLKFICIKFYSIRGIQISLKFIKIEGCQFENKTNEAV